MKEKWSVGKFGEIRLEPKNPDSLGLLSVHAWSLIKMEVKIWFYVYYHFVFDRITMTKFFFTFHVFPSLSFLLFLPHYRFFFSSPLYHFFSLQFLTSQSRPTHESIFQNHNYTEDRDIPSLTLPSTKVLIFRKVNITDCSLAFLRDEICSRGTTRNQGRFLF